jgi:hypothetical protein
MADRNRARLGFLISIFLFLCLLAAITLVGISGYEGNCISFEPPPEPCTLLEYLLPYLLLLVVFWIFGKPLLSLAILALILAPGITGWMLEKRRPDKESR